MTHQNFLSAPAHAPILTVMVDYGNAPFLWMSEGPGDRSIGTLVCDATHWDQSLPLSQGLWQKFADWAIEFDATEFYSEKFDANGWDWIDFHARGMQLAQWLKQEAGDGYRVVYDKPFEDPNHRSNERIEICANGSRVPLQPLHHLPEPIRFCSHIISGGQTGADRGALDFAIQHRYMHGGWAPWGRQAEDGTIPLKYQLTELPQGGGYRQRNKRNVQDSDGTLIVNLGELSGGSLATQVFALKMKKPLLVVQVDTPACGEVVAGIVAWLDEHAIDTLNVAGPRESKCPGIHRLTVELLKMVDAALFFKTSGHLE